MILMEGRQDNPGEPPQVTREERRVGFVLRRGGGAIRYESHDRM